MAKLSVKPYVSTEVDYDVIRPPAHYTEGSPEAEMFHGIVDVLESDGIVVQASDFIAISMLVDTSLQYTKALEESKDEPLLLTTSRGDRVKNPIVGMVQRARADLWTSINALGLSPKARLYVEKTTALTFKNV